MDPRVHIPLLNMDPGSIFRGSIFNMTPASSVNVVYTLSKMVRDLCRIVV